MYLIISTTGCDRVEKKKSIPDNAPQKASVLEAIGGSVHELSEAAPHGHTVRVLSVFGRTFNGVMGFYPYYLSIPDSPFIVIFLQENGAASEGRSLIIDAGKKTLIEVKINAIFGVLHQ